MLALIRPAVTLFLVALFSQHPPAQSQEKPPAPVVSGAQQDTKRPAPAPATREEEYLALDKAVESAQRDPQALIKNLEDFLAHYPQSARREQVLRTIYNQSLQANDPRKAADYAEKLLKLHPEDPRLLSSLVDLLDRDNDAARRERAAGYATRFIERAEKQAQESRPSAISAENWQEAQALERATGYLMRGKVYEKAGEIEKAFADFEHSYAAYPSAQVAERLGDLAARKGEPDRALDDYTTAFAFPDRSADPAHRSQLRKKLASAYVAKYQSEKGLGDLVLARYDELVRSLKFRWAAPEAPNAGSEDPFEYVLERPDGSSLPLSAYRGKVLVMDFWATWCHPCRTGGKILEGVVQNFRTEPAASFLAVNVDEDRAGVSNFIREEKWTVPVAYARGLDNLLGVHALPTLIIFDRDGRVAYRQEGLDPRTFGETVEKKLRQILRRPPTASP